MKQRKKHQRGKAAGTTVKARNTMACHPLLKKAAVHGQSKKAKRQQERVKLRKEECDYQSVPHRHSNRAALIITFPTATHVNNTVSVAEFAA